MLVSIFYMCHIEITWHISSLYLSTRKFTLSPYLSFSFLLSFLQVILTSSLILLQGLEFLPSVFSIFHRKTHRSPFILKNSWSSSSVPGFGVHHGLGPLYIYSVITPQQLMSFKMRGQKILKCRNSCESSYTLFVLAGLHQFSER